MKIGARIGIKLVLVVALATVAGGAGEASAKSSLKLSGHPLTPLLAPGQKLSAELTAKNRGRKRTGATRLQLVLSTDKRRSKKDFPLKGEVKVPALSGGKSKTITARAKLPRKIKQNGYRVLACAAEAKCRPLSGTVGVGPKVKRVSVTLSGDAARAGSELVTHDGGGVIDAVAADGTQYRLVVRPDPSRTIRS